MFPWGQYSVRLKVGPRVFSPTLLGTVLAAGMLAVLVSLGRWQLHRAAEKQVLFDEFAAGAGSNVELGSSTGPLQRYQHVSARGRYDPSAQLLIDNMVSNERAGYYVITPFELDSGEWFLVNRGWVPMGESRAVLPSIPSPEGEIGIRGRADLLPRPGIRMGTPAPLAPPFPVRANYPSLEAAHAVIGPRRWSTRTEVILLDAREPGGFVRDWAAPGFPPARHIAYAVQWFGLAAAMLVLYIIASLEKP